MSATVAMPDYSGAAAVKRPRGGGSNGFDGTRGGSNGHGALLPDLAPAPKPWKGAPLVAALLCVGFLMLQMLPATHVRHPKDPTRTWIPVQNLQNAGNAAANGVQSGRDLANSNFRDAAEGWDTVNQEHASAREFVNDIKSVPVDLFICTDEKDLRPVFVVMNSTLSNTRHQQRIHFHIITVESQRADWLVKLKELLPDANIDIVRDNIDFEAIKKHISFRKESKAREALTSPYNFLPFYIPHIFPNIHRFIYLDSDVVVQGDIEELFHVDLGDHAVAAVEDCSQKFEMYFNFDLLNGIQARQEGEMPWLPNRPFDPKTCIFNRGVLVMDPQRWIQQNLTQAIEWWMEEFHHADKALYKYGVSQPPFLLALYEKYKKLDTAWNTRGLGRNEFSEFERDYMSKLYSKKPGKRPFLSPNTDNSKILHYNGKYKPWKRNRVLKRNEQPASLCGSRSEDCAERWWYYISPLANENLKPIKELM